jgi:hypothetical protein
MDIAIGTGRDLTSATQMVQYAYAGNWGMLERYIPAIKEASSEEEKWSKLRQLFTGQAEAYGKTMAGQMTLLKNNLGDIKEAIGGLLSSAVAPLMTNINNLVRSFKAWLDVHPGIAKVITYLTGATGITALVTGFGLLATTLLIKAVPAIMATVSALWAQVTATLASIAATGYGIPIAVAAVAAIGALAFGVSQLASRYDAQSEATQGASESLEQYKTIQDSATESVKANSEALKQQAERIKAAHEALKGYIDFMGFSKGIPESYFTDIFGEEWKLPAGQRTKPMPQGLEIFPSFQHGGIMPYTGLAYLHKGETVLSNNENINIIVELDGEVIYRNTEKRILKELRLQGG